MHSLIYDATDSDLNLNWTNSAINDNLTSSFLSSTTTLLSIGSSVMFIVGLITNILNLVILSRKSMKSTTNKYLSALALCDLFVLIFSILSLSNDFMNTESNDSSFLYTQSINLDSNYPTQTNKQKLKNSFELINSKNDYFHFYLMNYYSWNIYPRVYPYTYPLAIMFQIGTVWINLSMSTDRFIAIHFPLKSLKFCTITNAKKIITYIFIFSFLYSFPRFFEFYVKKENFTIVNNETYEFIHSDLTRFGKSNLYRRVIYVYMYMFLQSVVPLLTLSIINIALIFSLKESNKLLKKFTPIDTEKSRVNSINQSFRFKNKDGYKRRDITVMLITVVLIFVILQSPAVICNCFYGFNHYKLALTKESYSINTVCNVGNFFILTCSSINFFTYCLFNKRFRKELILFLMKLLCLTKFIKYKYLNRFSTYNNHNGFNANSLMPQSSSYYYKNSFRRRSKLSNVRSISFKKNDNQNSVELSPNELLKYGLFKERNGKHNERLNSKFGSISGESLNELNLYRKESLISKSCEIKKSRFAFV